MEKPVTAISTIVDAGTNLSHEVNTETNNIKIEQEEIKEFDLESNIVNQADEWKHYCPFVLPKGRNVTALDDFVGIKKNLNDFRNETLANLGLEKLDYDLSKIEERKNLLSNYNIYSKDKWYLCFQPLNNVSIEHYWKYEKVTLTDIINSAIDTFKNVELKKNKKYLKHVAKYILSGKPHESLVKNGYKIYANFLSSASKYAVNPLNTANASLLSLKNSKCINDSDKLLKWKFKFTNNLSLLQNLKGTTQTYKKGNSSTVNTHDTRERKTHVHFNPRSSDTGVNKHSSKKVIKDNIKKSKRKRH